MPYYSRTFLGRKVRHKLPISQVRMIALINAAEDYQQAYHRLLSLIRSAAKVDTVGALRDLDTQTCDMINILKNPARSPVIIDQERRHFRVNKRRNERNAERQEVRASIARAAQV